MSQSSGIFRIDTEGDYLFRSAGYMASGFFYNSQILRLDHERKGITFQFRSWMEPGTRKKNYGQLTLNVFEFMARMLYYLPDHYEKEIRYYGIYSPRYHRAAQSKLPTSGECIEHSFGKGPEKCPDCGARMEKVVHFRHPTAAIWNRLIQTHSLSGGYFSPIRPPYTTETSPSNLKSL